MKLVRSFKKTKKSKKKNRYFLKIIFLATKNKLKIMAEIKIKNVEPKLKIRFDRFH